MKVKDLILHLQGCDQEAMVVVDGYGDGYGDGDGSGYGTCQQLKRPE